MAAYQFNLNDITKHLDREMGDPTSGPYITAQDIKDSFQELTVNQVQEAVKEAWDEIVRVDGEQQKNIPKATITAAGDLLIGTGAATPAALRISSSTGDVLTVTGAGTVGWSDALSTVVNDVGTLSSTISGITSDVNTINNTWLPRISQAESDITDLQTQDGLLRVAIDDEKDRVDDLVTALGVTFPLPATGYVNIEARLVSLQGTVSTADQNATNAVNTVTTMGTRVQGLETWRTTTDNDIADLTNDLQAVEETINTDDGSGVQVGGLPVGIKAHLALVEQSLATDVADLAAFKSAVAQGYAPLSDFQNVQTVVGDATSGLVKEVQDLGGLRTSKADDQVVTTLTGTVNAQVAKITALENQVNALVAHIKNTTGATVADIVTHLQATP